MRKIVVISILCLVMGFSFKVDTTSSSLSIHDAIKAGMLDAKASSFGNYSGKCVSLELLNKQKIAAKIMVPAGSVFYALNEAEQDIIVTHDQLIVLKPGEKKLSEISGYCCKMKNRVPGTGSGFKIGTTNNAQLQKLANYTNLKDSLNDHLVQEAVWSVSDGNDVSNIYDASDTISSTGLRKTACQITGRPDTWYNTQQARKISDEGMIESNPVKITGKLKYILKGPATVHSELLTAKDNSTKKLGGSMPLPRAGTYDFDFKLTVEGYEKGTYYVLVFADGQQILKQEFKI